MTVSCKLASKPLFSDTSAAKQTVEAVYTGLGSQRSDFFLDYRRILAAMLTYLGFPYGDVGQKVGVVIGEILQHANLEPLFYKSCIRHCNNNNSAIIICSTTSHHTVQSVQSWHDITVIVTFTVCITSPCKGNTHLINK